MPNPSVEIQIVGGDDLEVPRRVVACAVEMHQAAEFAETIRADLTSRAVEALLFLYDADASDCQIDVVTKNSSSFVLSIQFSDEKVVDLLASYRRPELARYSNLFVQELMQAIADSELPISPGSVNAYAVTDFHWEFQISREGSEEITDQQLVAEYMLEAAYARQIGRSFLAVDPEKLDDAQAVINNKINAEAIAQEIQQYLGSPEARVMVRVLPMVGSSGARYILLELMILGIQNHLFTQEDYGLLLKKLENLVVSQTGFPFMVDEARSKPFMPRERHIGKHRGKFSCGMAQVGLIWNL